MCRKELFELPGPVIHPETVIDPDDASGNENRPTSVSSNLSIPESNPTAEDLLESLLEVERETIEIEESLGRLTELLRERELLLRQRELLQTARAEREVALRQLQQALDQSTEHSGETPLAQHTLSGEVNQGDDACSSAASYAPFDEERTGEDQTEQEESPEDVLEHVRNLGIYLEEMRRRFEDICAGLDRLAI
jgi:multidrug efflux pump subunit AcrA (membrane-fusion protein)